MSIYVVTSVHNRKEITLRFAESLMRQSVGGDVRLILVDDGSTDGTDAAVRAVYPDTLVLYGNGNLFWGGAMHLAYRHLKKAGIREDDIVFYVNDDSRLPDDFLEQAVRELKAHPNDLLTGCAYGIGTGLYLDGPVMFNLHNGAVTLLPEGSEGNCASTRALLMYGRVFLDIGGFHPILLPHYGSDYEYTIRACKKGHRIISSERVRYGFSEETTGDNSHKNLTIKKVMSKRSKLNPFYKLNLILLIAPVWRLPAFIGYQLKSFRRHERDQGRAV